MLGCFVLFFGENLSMSLQSRLLGAAIASVLAVSAPVLAGNANNTSAAIRARVETARGLQAERFRKNPGIHTNSAMTPRLLKKYCELDAEGAAYLEHNMSQMNFSARAHDRILKVARTLADLKGQDQIDADSVLEAVNYRTLDRNLWS